jgi:hypothetical protein
MKKLIYTMWIVFATFTIGCDDDDNKLPLLTPEASGTMTDKEGNEYTWVRYNGLDWMTSNLKAGTPYYELTGGLWNDPLIRIDNMEQALADYSTYGNLYSYEAAIANQPAGWRLPTDEDWKKLEQALGMSEKTTDAVGWRGNGAGELIQQDNTGSGIHLLLGGNASMSAGNYNAVMLRQVREYGYYWSSTVDESYTVSTAVYYRRIRANSSQIERNTATVQETDHTSDKYDRYMSVRYVRDAQ